MFSCFISHISFRTFLSSSRLFSLYSPCFNYFPPFITGIPLFHIFFFLLYLLSALFASVHSFKYLLSKMLCLLSRALFDFRSTSSRKIIKLIVSYLESSISPSTYKKNISFRTSNVKNKT